MKILSRREPSEKTALLIPYGNKKVLKIHRLLILLMLAVTHLFFTTQSMAAFESSSPFEEICLERNGINSNWIRIRESLLGDNVPEPFNVPRAWGFTGSITIEGEQTVLTSDGKGRLSYCLKENFAGNFITIFLFDPSSREFQMTDQAILNTLSTGIELSSAKLLTSSMINDNLQGESPLQLDIFSPDRDELFPGFHSEVIRGSVQGTNMELDIRSPKLNFSSDFGNFPLERFNYGTGIPMAELKKLAKGKELSLNRKIISGENTAELKVHIIFDEPGVKSGPTEGKILIGNKINRSPDPTFLMEAEYLEKMNNNNYRFLILRGQDQVSFREGKRDVTSSSGQTELLLLSPSREQDDVIIEIEREGTEKEKISDLISLTLIKPSRLKYLDDEKVREMGYFPFINYRQLLLEGRPRMVDIPGKIKQKITDGYSRTFFYRIFDQFGSPVRKKGIKGESRIILRNGEENSRIGQTTLPLLMGYKQMPESENIFTKDIFTGEGGMIKDKIDIKISGDLRGISADMDVTMEQEIYVMGWHIGSRNIQFMESDVRTGPWKKIMKQPE